MIICKYHLFNYGWYINPVLHINFEISIITNLHSLLSFFSRLVQLSINNDSTDFLSNKSNTFVRRKLAKIIANSLLFCFVIYIRN